MPSPRATRQPYPPQPPLSSKSVEVGEVEATEEGTAARVVDHGEPGLFARRCDREHAGAQLIPDASHPRGAHRSSPRSCDGAASTFLFLSPLPCLDLYSSLSDPTSSWQQTR